MQNVSALRQLAAECTKYAKYARPGYKMPSFTKIKFFGIC